MSPRIARLAACALAGLAVASLVGFVVLLVANRHAGASGAAFAYWSIPVNAMPLLGFVALGYLVATRQPGNPIGWLMLALPAAWVCGPLLQQYAAFVLIAHPGAGPGGVASAASIEGGWVPSLLLIVLITFLFPTGSLPSARWRPAVAVAVVSLTAVFVVAHFSALDPPFEGISNPIRIDPGAWALAVFAPLALGVAVGLLSACASVVVRFRRSNAEERAQLKWFLFAASLIPVGIAAHTVAESLASGAVGAVEAIFDVALTVMPVAIGVAILRYRLYDIDTVISKTLVYGLLTLMLVVAYSVLVLAAQAVFSSVAGGSNLAIALSTLVVAALFLPLRGRVQRLVDRRFYRHRYAQRTLEAFGARLREQVELDGLRSGLEATVRETMQPAHASVWLRSGGRP